MKKLFLAAFTCFTALWGSAQSGNDSLLREVTLEQAVNYSLKHQPIIQQSEADEKITEANIRSRLADWYPQISFNYLLQRNFVVQTAVIGGNPIKLGVNNTSAAQFQISQTLFNRDVLLASRTRNQVRQQVQQATSNNRIAIAAEVSKAFYDVLSSFQQVKVSNENITRIERSLQDAYNQYKAGVADKTDYKRATIALNNARALRKTNEELLKSRTEYLKSVMGYPKEGDLSLMFDSLQMEKDVFLDTLQQLDPAKRIEYQQLQTENSLLQANLRYSRWSYLPSLSVNGAYNFNYQNNRFNKLYDVNYPNSFALLTFSLPIFEGGRRKADVEAAQWQLQRNRIAITGLQNNLNSEFEAAMANYKSNLANYLALKENLQLAREVYDVIQLQYRSGIKTYLEVINSETDLRTAQINYYNSLYAVLSSKIDVQRALGQLNY